MFYKRLLLFLILIITVFNFIGCIQPDSDTKIKANSMQYLKDKYNEDFEFKDIKTSWNEGDCFWRYNVCAIPKNNPDMTIYVSSKEGLNEFHDNYKKQMWDNPREKYMKNFIQTKFGESTHFSLYFKTTEDIENKYSVNDEPLDIIKKESNYKKDFAHSQEKDQVVYEDIYAYIPIDEGINEDEIATNLLDVMKYYDDLNLYFELNLYFGKEKINRENNTNPNGTFKNDFASIKIDSNTIAEKDNLKKLIKYYKNGVIINNQN